MENLRIVMCSDTYLHNPNGISMSISALQRELQALGHKVWVVAPSTHPCNGIEKDVIRIPSLPYPFYRDLRIALPFSKGFPQNADIIHSHTPFSIGTLAVRMSKKQKVPLVSTVHVDFHGYTHFVPVLDRVQRRIDLVSKWMKARHHHAQVIYTPSQYGKLILERAGVGNRIVILPNGVDIHTMSQSESLPDVWPAGQDRLLFVGRLSAEKKVSVILNALKYVPNSHLLIVGDGPERQQTLALIDNLNLDQRVTIVPSVPHSNIGSYYRTADVLVSASTNETQGLAVWEALAMGTPVVVANSGGTAEAVIDAVTGFLAKPDDPISFACRINCLLQNPQLRADFGIKAKNLDNSTNAQSSILALIESYREVIQNWKKVTKSARNVL